MSTTQNLGLILGAFGFTVVGTSLARSLYADWRAWATRTARRHHPARSTR